MPNETLQLPALYLERAIRGEAMQNFRSLDKFLKKMLQKLLEGDFKLVLIPIVEQSSGEMKKFKVRNFDMRYQRTLDYYLDSKKKY